VQALEREGVRQLFAYPGGASMEIHQALTRSPLIRNILCRHEQVRQRSRPEEACVLALQQLVRLRAGAALLDAAVAKMRLIHA